jgi:hypothetical protein
MRLASLDLSHLSALMANLSFDCTAQLHRESCSSPSLIRAALDTNPKVNPPSELWLLTVIPAAVRDVILRLAFRRREDNIGRPLQQLRIRTLRLFD